MKGLTWLRFICAWLALAIGGLLYAGWVQSAVRQSLPGQTHPLFAYGQSLDQGLSVVAEIAAIVPERSRLELRLELVALGNLVDEQARLTEPVELVVNGLNGRQSFFFRAGQALSTFTVLLPLRGSSFYYPRDMYRGWVEVEAYSGAHQPLPLKISGKAELTGFSLCKTELMQSSGKRLKEYDPTSPHRLVVLLEARRSPLVQASANLIVVLQWMLGLTVVAVFLSIWILERKLETTVFVWITTVLFALPSLRSTMVDAPAIGIYIDFFGFLCCEAAVASVLVGLVFLWLWRARQ